MWVKTADGKWRHGQVVSDESYRYGADVRIFILFNVLNAHSHSSLRADQIANLACAIAEIKTMTSSYLWTE